MNTLPAEDGQQFPSEGIPDQSSDGGDYKAFVAWRASKGKGVKGKGKGKGKDPVCINCGGKGHIIAQCKKPLVPFSERPCLRCFKPGHLSWNCPDRPKPANAVDNAPPLVHTMMMGLAQGYSAVTQGYSAVTGYGRGKGLMSAQYEGTATCNRFSKLSKLPGREMRMLQKQNGRFSELSV